MSDFSKPCLDLVLYPEVNGKSLKGPELESDMS